MEFTRIATIRQKKSISQKIWNYDEKNPGKVSAVSLVMLIDWFFNFKWISIKSLHCRKYHSIQGAHLAQSQINESELVTKHDNYYRFCANCGGSPECSNQKRAFSLWIVLSEFSKHGILFPCGFTPLISAKFCNLVEDADWIALDRFATENNQTNIFLPNKTENMLYKTCFCFLSCLGKCFSVWKEYKFCFVWQTFVCCRTSVETSTLMRYYKLECFFFFLKFNLIMKRATFIHFKNR